MIAVLFEVTPHPHRKGDYFEIAAKLRPLLERIDGFVSVERFESLSTPGKFLSLSVFRDEAAVVRWREAIEHRAAQEEGRNEIFADYRLRVANVMRDDGLKDRSAA